MPITAHSIYEVTERQLFSLALPTAEDLPARLELPSTHFACLLAWDARLASTASISALADRLLRAGASYFVCWGPDCGRVHDVIDETLTHPGNNFGVPDDSCIMTTWHDSEPLKDAIWFFLVCAWPDDHYFESTRAALAISVGSRDWATEISAALQDPREFVRRGSANDVA
jgi:hypothetical protein